MKRKERMEGNEISAVFEFVLGGYPQKVMIEGKEKSLPEVSDRGTDRASARRGNDGGAVSGTAGADSLVKTLYFVGCGRLVRGR